MTPRATRLVRAAGLGGFRAALVSLACDGPPLAARDRLILVPTRAAAAHLTRTIEQQRLADGHASVLPEFATAAELPWRVAERLDGGPAPAAPAVREVLLGVACRRAEAAGVPPPFTLRPALVAEILRFYDTLRRHRRDVETFERLALGALEPGAEHDRGAERLVRQTRFLAAAFREFERACAELDLADEHRLRRLAIVQPAARPWRHVVVAVGDRSRDSYGLFAADWEVLARVPGLERLDVVTTDGALAGAFHQQVHDLLPGIEEVRAMETPAAPPRLRVPGGGALTWQARDREEEVAEFARWVRDAAARGEVDRIDAMALVVRQPLPYVYLAREVLRSAGIPCQTFDALPLAAEPYAAAFDLVCSFVSSNFARGPSIALLHSAHFRFDVDPRSVTALDRVLAESGYLGELEVLAGLIERWAATALPPEGGSHTPPARGRAGQAWPAAQRLLSLADELMPLTSPMPVGEQLALLLQFLIAHDHVPGPDAVLRARQRRARGAVHGILASLRDAYRAHDPEPAEFDTVAALVRRWIDGHTFAPHTGGAGVHLVDADSARFGDFACAQLAGVVDGEWPDRPARSVFYSASILRELGWPPDTERLDGARAAFADLLRLPASMLAVSSFALEHDAVVAGSTLLDEVERAGLEADVAPATGTRIFEYELTAPAAAGPMRPPGKTAGHAAAAVSLSALERYQDCPFRFFAADVLQLEEIPEDEPSLSPRARGRFVHEVFQRFFEAWVRRAVADGRSRTITPGHFDEARTLFAEIAEGLLARLPDADAALERARLFGSAIATGMVDLVLGIEATRGGEVRDRLLEHRFEGAFALGGSRQVMLRGVADRIDLLAGKRLRVIDYKTGSAPKTGRALQAPIYALCAQEELAARGDGAWEIEQADYVAFSGKRALVPVLRGGADEREATLGAARERLQAAIDGITRGEFPPRPHDEMICSYCAYASVCRKDYVGDE
ncbi:MAG: PD-(D/E)XK nuclease family protein [Vicinamibacterales bacterium]